MSIYIYIWIYTYILFSLSPYVYLNNISIFVHMYINIDIYKQYMRNIFKKYFMGCTVQPRFGITRREECAIAGCVPP